MRIRITFSKTEAMRYTGHLDLHRAWERTMRRAKLPLAYSLGFTPHPKITLASALPLGFTGEREVVDVWLEYDLPIEDIQAHLVYASPPGIEIRQVEQVDERSAALQTIVQASEYWITFLAPTPDLKSQVAGLLAALTLPRERRGKAYDLRPLILELECPPDDADGRQRLLVQMATRESATGRPEEIAALLGVAFQDIRVHRSQIIFS
jgi:radical SAM-linked protein